MLHKSYFSKKPTQALKECYASHTYRRMAQESYISKNSTKVIYTFHKCHKNHTFQKGHKSHTFQKCYTSHIQRMPQKSYFSKMLHKSYSKNATKVILFKNATQVIFKECHKSHTFQKCYTSHIQRMPQKSYFSKMLHKSYSKKRANAKLGLIGGHLAPLPSLSPAIGWLGGCGGAHAQLARSLSPVSQRVMLLSIPFYLEYNKPFVLKTHRNVCIN